MGSLIFRSQIANQFGDYGSNARRGIGSYVFIDRVFNGIVWSPKVGIGFVYLSGDDKKTARNEGWDPLFSRWEWMSPMYARSMCAETGILGYWTNMRIFRANLFLKPTEKINFYLWYNLLQANEQVPPNVILSGNGKNRGHLPQLKLEYLVNKNMTTCFFSRVFDSGEFLQGKRPGTFLADRTSV